MSNDEDLFADALALPAEKRSAFLDGICAGDLAQRGRIEALLHYHEIASVFLEHSPVSRYAMELDEQPGEMIGRYKLLQKIGEGGCGVVWMAEQAAPVRRRVALKIIKLGMDTRAVVARFEAERQALAMMDHPNIAKVLDGGATEKGRPYFVMELVRGILITRYCDDNQLTPPARLELFIKVCEAVQHAHQKGIIHRDLKPSNILVTENDDGAAPKIIDFGIAKATQGRLTEATLFTAFEQFIGTPVYMSPEQAEMSWLDIDTRADIYSLGVLLYELLTGKLPFDIKGVTEAGLDAIKRTIRETEPPRPSDRLRTLNDDERATIARLRNTAPVQLAIVLRGDLDWIVMRCLEKDRMRRYDTASGLAADIRRHLRNEPVVARPPSVAYLLGKTIRRHRWGVAAGASIALSLLAGLALSTMLFLSEREARQRAVAAEQIESTLRQEAERAKANELILRVRAEAEEGRAADAARRSARVESILRSVLQSVSPKVALGRTSVHAMLSEAEKRLDVELRDQPEMLAELRDTLGTLYQDIGDYPRAIACQRAALAQRRALFGERHADVATSLDHLGVALQLNFDLDEAEGTLRDSLALRRALVGVEDAEVATTMSNLSVVLLHQRRLGESHRLSAEVLELRRKLLGPEHPDVAKALLQLARASAASGALTRAESLFQEAIAMQRRLLGSNNPDLAPTLTAYARAIQSTRPDEAVTLSREVFTLLRGVFGNEHTLTLRAARHYAECLFRTGEVDQAWGLLTEWMPVMRKVEPGAIVGALTTLGEIRLRRAGPDSEAEALAREAANPKLLLPYVREEGNPIAPTELLQRILRQQGKAEKDVHDSRVAAIQELEQRLGAGHRWTVTTLAAFARAYYYDHKPEDALLFAEKAAAAVRGTPAAGEEVATSNQRILGYIYRDLDRADKAVGVLQAVLTTMREGTPAPRDLADALFELAHTCLRADRLNEARKAFDEATSVRAASARERLDLTEICWRENKHDAARVELRAALGLLEEAEAGGAPVPFARALALRARIEDAEVGTKRAWLERAIGYLRPAAAAGRLTPYERNVLFAGIESQLALLDGSRPP